MHCSIAISSLNHEPEVRAGSTWEGWSCLARSPFWTETRTETGTERKNYPSCSLDMSPINSDHS